MALKVNTFDFIQHEAFILGGASEETELWPLQWFAKLLLFSLALNIFHFVNDLLMPKKISLFFHQLQVAIHQDTHT